MHLSSYLGLLETGCATLAQSYRQVAEGHAGEADVSGSASNSRLSAINTRSSWAVHRPVWVSSVR